MATTENKRLAGELEEYKHLLLKEAIATRHLKLVAAELRNKVASLEERLSEVCKTPEVKPQPVPKAQPEVKLQPEAKPVAAVKPQPVVKPPPPAKVAAAAQPEQISPPSSAARQSDAPQPAGPSFEELSAKIRAQAKKLVGEIDPK